MAAFNDMCKRPHGKPTDTVDFASAFSGLLSAMQEFVINSALGRENPPYSGESLRM